MADGGQRRAGRAGSMNAGAALLEPALSKGQKDDPAILWDGGTVTYGDLDAASNRFANA